MPVFNLRHATFKHTLVYAKLLSRMTNEEISEASGIGLAQVSRYFQENDTYSPSPALIPALCRVLENTILVDWLNAQVEDLRPGLNIKTAADLTQAVMRATANTGDLNSETLKAITDGSISQQEAQALQAQFWKNGQWNLQAADALESLAKGSQAKQ